MDRRIRRTKQVLKDTMIELMREEKFKDISVTDIVNRADYSRAAFYTHFKDKDALLQEVTSEVLDDLSRAYEEPYHEVYPFYVDMLKPENIKIFHHVERHKDFYKVVVDSEALPGFQKMITAKLKHLLITDFESRKTSTEVEKELMAGYQAYAIYGMIIEWVEGDYRYSADHMAKQLLLILRTRLS